MSELLKVIVEKEEFLKEIENSYNDFIIQFNNKAGNKILEIELNLIKKEISNFAILYQDEKIKSTFEEYMIEKKFLKYRDIEIYNSEYFKIRILHNVNLWSDEIDLININNNSCRNYSNREFDSFEKRNEYLIKLFNSLYDFSQNYELIQDEIKGV